MKDKSFTTAPEQSGLSKKILTDHHSMILDFMSGELDQKYILIKTLYGQEQPDMVPAADIQLNLVDLRMYAGDHFVLPTLTESSFGNSIPVILLTVKNTRLRILRPGPTPAISAAASNKLFLEKLNTVIQHHIDNEDLDVGYIANLMCMSKPTLYRKIKGMHGLSINELINTTRLKVAAKLLEDGRYKIYEVSNLVGYRSQCQLSRNFVKRFGITPTEYRQSKRKVIKLNLLHPDQTTRQAI